MNARFRQSLRLAALPAIAALALAAGVMPGSASQAAAATPAAPAAASAPTAATAPTAQLSAAELAVIAARFPGAKAEDLRVTPIPGIYELRRGAELVYVTADGKYGFAGDLYRLADSSNLSDVRRRELRLALLNPIPESSMVVFAPAAAPKYTITVFTDVDCTYCRALHKQIADYNRLGIKVRYMFYPRSGPNTESWSKAEQVWCSPDRRAALTAAKQGTPLKAAVCKPNPVAQQYALGQSMGMSGTPGIITPKGDLLPGYAPPDEMLQLLQQEAQPGNG